MQLVGNCPAIVANDHLESLVCTKKSIVMFHVEQLNCYGWCCFDTFTHGHTWLQRINYSWRHYYTLALALLQTLIHYYLLLACPSPPSCHNLWHANYTDTWLNVTTILYELHYSLETSLLISLNFSYDYASTAVVCWKRFHLF